MIGRWLCRLGVHDWSYANGRNVNTYYHGDLRRRARERHCRRCSAILTDLIIRHEKPMTSGQQQPTILVIDPHEIMTGSVRKEILEARR